MIFQLNAISHCFKRLNVKEQVIFLDYEYYIYKTEHRLAISVTLIRQFMSILLA